MSSIIDYTPFASNEIHSKQMENSYLKRQIEELIQRNNNLVLLNDAYKHELKVYKDHNTYVNGILDHAREQLELVEADYARLKKHAESLEQALNKK